MMLLFGGAMLAICALIMVVYFVQKSFSRAWNPQAPKSPKMRVENEAAFTLATVQGVVAQLKNEQKTAQEKLLAAERRAEENARKFELLAREIDYGLMTFDAKGYMTFSNALVRKLLAVDTWARRRYGEIFQDFPALSQLIAECFETGTETRKRTLEIPGVEGSARRLEVSVLQTRDPTGALEIVACMFRDLSPTARDA
jgi:PAS domain-containing protein